MWMRTLSYMSVSFPAPYLPFSAVRDSIMVAAAKYSLSSHPRWLIFNHGHATVCGNAANKVEEQMEEVRFLDHELARLLLELPEKGVCTFPF